jgi:hypothetical protein
MTEYLEDLRSRIVQLVVDAEKLKGLTGDQKREFVIDNVRLLTKDDTNFYVNLTDCIIDSCLYLSRHPELYRVLQKRCCRLL